jgi:hypothetical protein
MAVPATMIHLHPIIVIHQPQMTAMILHRVLSPEAAEKDETNSLMDAIMNKASEELSAAGITDLFVE